MILGPIQSSSSYFCSQFDLLKTYLWDPYPFLWLFSWFKKWHFRQFWHISSRYWRNFCEWVDKAFYKQFTLFFRAFAVDLIYWREIFLNAFTKHFTSNLLFSFVFLRSTWLTREEFLYSISFSFTFFSIPELTLLAVLAHFSTYWSLFSESVAKSIWE